MERLEIQLLSTPEFNTPGSFAVRILINDKETLVTELSKEQNTRIAHILQNASQSFDKIAKGKQPHIEKFIENGTNNTEI